MHTVKARDYALPPARLPNITILASCLALSISLPSVAAVIEVGDLNIIADPGNPSNGLAYLDMTYSDGQTLANALSAAQAVYPEARLATPSEYDHLFAAAGITYDNPLVTASNTAFSPGGFTVLSSGTNYDNSLVTILGPTTILGGGTVPLTGVWTDPDGSNDPLTTRDQLRLWQNGPNQLDTNNYSFTPPDGQFGWLLVTAVPVPEPSSLAVATLGLVSLGMLGRRRRKR